MDFTFVSGHVALDLAGTVGHRDSDRYDRLTDPEALARWIVAAGLLETAPAVDAAGLAATVTLREALYRLARARVEGVRPDPADLAVLNRAAVPAPIALQLDNGAISHQGDLTAVRSTIARSAVELLGGPTAGTLKACGAARCTRLYLDNSRRGSRRWCDMRECGNRAKAAAFRRRRATSASEAGRLGTKVITTTASPVNVGETLE